MATPDKKHGLKHTGPGGMDCPCCGPAPGKGRRVAKREWKRGYKAIVKREIEAEIVDHMAGIPVVMTGLAYAAKLRMDEINWELMEPDWYYDDSVCAVCGDPNCTYYYFDED